MSLKESQDRSIGKIKDIETSQYIVHCQVRDTETKEQEFTVATGTRYKSGQVFPVKFRNSETGIIYYESQDKSFLLI